MKFADVIVGSVIFVLLVYGAVVAVTDKTGDLLRKCEANLPRNQHCILVAVPKESAQESNSQK